MDDGSLALLAVFRRNNSTYIYGTVNVTSTVTCTSVIQTSDESIKANVRDIDLTPTFDNVSPKAYTRTDKPELGERVGFIAQDIQKACADNGLPDSFTSDVVLDDDTTLLGLDYARLCAVLWSKVRQLETRLRTIELAIENA